MIPAFPVYLFDVDGTLLDSAPDICGAIRAALSKTDRNDLEEVFLRRYIGRHLIDFFQDVFPHYTSDQIEDLIRDYRSIYPTRGHRMTQLYPGVKEALGVLPGKKSTATTKGTPTTKLVLEMFGLIDHFDHVQGTDGFPAKPEPDVIFKALESLGEDARDCLMVGDSSADMEAGRRAGVKTCAVRYGYGDPGEIAKWKPDYWIDDLRDLVPDGISNGHSAQIPQNVRS